MREDEIRYAEAEVSAQDAVDAAIARAGRTQHALILAEAQILWWKRRYAEAVQVAEGWERQTLALRERFGVGEVETYGEASGGGDAAGGEADRAAPLPA